MHQTHHPAHWADSALCVVALAPAVLPVDVAARHVHVRLLLRVGQRVLGGQHQRVQAHGTLRPTGVYLCNLGIELTPTLTKPHDAIITGDCSKLS